MKKPVGYRPWWGMALGLLLMAWAPSAMACAACFGRSDSELAQGMNMGILTLLVVVVTVLSGLATFFVFLARRSAAVPRSRQASPGDGRERRGLDE